MKVHPLMRTLRKKKLPFQTSSFYILKLNEAKSFNKFNFLLHYPYFSQTCKISLRFVTRLWTSLWDPLNQMTFKIILTVKCYNSMIEFHLYLKEENWGTEPRSVDGQILKICLWKCWQSGPEKVIFIPWNS